MFQYKSIRKKGLENRVGCYNFGYPRDDGDQKKIDLAFVPARIPLWSGGGRSRIPPYFGVPTELAEALEVNGVVRPLTDENHDSFMITDRGVFHE